jgi:hypothetical protein
MTMYSASGHIGQTVALKAKLEREVGVNTENYVALQGKYIAFKINGAKFVLAPSGSTGEASVSYKIPSGMSPGTKQLTAEFTGDSRHTGSSATTSLVVEGP